MTDITVGNMSSTSNLRCITDKMPCCAMPPNRHGEWLFPDASIVPRFKQHNESAKSFFRNRDDYGGVNLIRVTKDVQTPSGLFCCKVPNTYNVIHTLCVNIGECSYLQFHDIKIND